MKKFISEIKQIRDNMKVFSLRTSNIEYKKNIQKLIVLTNHIVPGTNLLPLRTEILEHNVNSISDMPKCFNQKCNNVVFNFDSSKNRFCSRKCACNYNNKNMSKESRIKAANSRNYRDIHKKRVKTMMSIIEGNGKTLMENTAIKAAKNRNYKDIFIKRLPQWIKSRELSGTIIKDKDRSDWGLYKKKVRYITEKTYKDYKSIIDPNNLRENNVYDLDHIISVKYGFENYIPIWILICKENLRVIPTSDNLKKGSKVSRPKETLEYILSCY